MPHRNPAAYIIWSYHEAGHAIVGHYLGWNLERVRMTDKVARAEFQEVRVGLPMLTSSKKERARRIAEMRRAMTVLVAGDVAATIHQKEVERRGFTSRQEARGYETWWACRVSILFQTSYQNDN